MGTEDASILFELESAVVSNSIGKTWSAFDRTGHHSVFQTWTWVGSLLGLLPPDVTPAFLIAKSKAGIVGLGLLRIRHVREYHLFPVRKAWFNATGEELLDRLTVEYNSFASPQPNDSNLWAAFIAAFERGIFDADELILPGVVSDITSLVGSRLLHSTHTISAYRTCLRTISEHDSFASTLKTAARQQLNRNLRACRQMGDLHVSVASDVDTALAYFSELKNFHVASWKLRRKPHAFEAPFFEVFHRDLISKGVLDGTVELMRIGAGDSILGYLYNFRRNGVIYSYQSGFNASLSRNRPGYVCHALAIEHYAASGALTYDFLAGYNQLKQTYASEVYPMSWHRLRQPRVLFRAEAMAKRLLRALVYRRARAE